MMDRHIKAPLNDDEVKMLKAGDFKSVEEARTTIHESFGIKIYK